MPATPVQSAVIISALRLACRDTIAALLPCKAIPQVLVWMGLAPVVDATPPSTPLQPTRGQAC